MHELAGLPDGGLDLVGGGGSERAGHVLQNLPVKRAKDVQRMPEPGLDQLERHGSRMGQVVQRGRLGLHVRNIEEADEEGQRASYFVEAGAGAGVDSTWLFCSNMDLKSPERFHTSLNET
jgi:hypothetical protein